VLVGGIVAIGAALEARGIKVEHFVLLPWPRPNLAPWLIEVAGISLVVVLLRRES
jgi:hypothetical protein